MESWHIYNTELYDYLRRTMFTGISVRNIKRERKGAERKMMSIYI